MVESAAHSGYSSSTPNDRHTGDTINGRKTSVRSIPSRRAAAACSTPNTAEASTAQPEKRSVFHRAESVSSSHSTRHAEPARAA